MYFYNLSVKHKHSPLLEERNLPNDGAGLEWTDYGARMNDNQIGRWNHIDPLAHLREWLSPYNFVQNNPINRVGADRLGGKNGLLDVHDFKNPVFKTINDYLSPGTPTDFNIYCAPCNTKIRTDTEAKEFREQIYKVMNERPKF